MDKISSNNQWLEALSQLQSGYWSAWSDAFGQAQPTGGTAVWQEAAESWRNLLSTDSSDEVMDNVLSQGRAFLQMTEDVLRAGADSVDVDGLIRGWTEGWQNATGSGEGLAALWGMPQDTLRRTLSAFSALPGDALERYKHEGVSRLMDPLREQVEKVLSVPALGYTRESQEQHQHAAREMLEFQAAFQRYLAILAGAGRNAIDILQDKLAQASEPGRGIDSLRGLYDLWVDASEQAFAEVALSDEHQAAYGEMVNSMMRLKKHAQSNIEHQMGALGIPGRSELNSAHKMIHALRREVAALRGEVRKMSEQPNAGSGESTRAHKAPGKKTSTASGRATNKSVARRKVSKRVSKRVSKKKASQKKGGDKA